MRFASAKPRMRAWKSSLVSREGSGQIVTPPADKVYIVTYPGGHGFPESAFIRFPAVRSGDWGPNLLRLEWIRAEDAVFRIGDERPRLIMGRAVMVYRDRATAEKAIRHGPVEFLDFDALQAGWRRSTP